MLSIARHLDLLGEEDYCQAKRQAHYWLNGELASGRPDAAELAYFQRRWA